MFSIVWFVKAVQVLFSMHLTCRVCVCFSPGADEQDLSGDSEAGSDGRGVVPQTEAGQHGGDTHQHTPTRSREDRAEQSRGMESQQTCVCESVLNLFNNSRAAVFCDPGINNLNAACL